MRTTEAKTYLGTRVLRAGLIVCAALGLATGCGLAQAQESEPLYHTPYGDDPSFELGLYMGCNPGLIVPADPEQFLDGVETELAARGETLDRDQALRGYSQAIEDPLAWCE